MAFTNLTMAVRKSGFKLLPAIMFAGVSANRWDKNLFSEQVAQSDEHAEFIERAGYSSAAVAPLVARGRVLGTLSVLHAASDGRTKADPFVRFQRLTPNDIQSPANTP